jgi:hypothetical protein
VFAQAERLPGAAEAICRTLLAAPGKRLKRDSLLARLRPGLDSRDSVVMQTLLELRSIGVILEEDDRVAVCAALRDRGIEDLREVILEAILADAANHEFWAESDEALDQTGGMDVARAITWFLTLPVREAPWAWDGRSSIQQRQIDEVGLKLVQNDTRWPFFVRWASYLGLSTPVADTTALVPDPTGAVRPALARLVRKKGAVPVSTVMRGLAAELPVLEGGWLHAKLVERNPLVAGPTLSPAMSFVFIRLQGEGTIELQEGLGDAEKVTFADGLGAFHALRWTGATA